MNISDRDKEILVIFCTRAREIANTSIFRDNKYNISLTISGKEGEPIKFTESAPEKEALVNLITILRQFYAPRESINFNKVYDIVLTYIDHKNKNVKDCATSAKKAFQIYKTKCNFQIVVNNKKLKPIEIIDLWFNANIFHADPNKIKKFDELSRTPVAPFMSFEFKTAMMNLSNVIIYFGSFIEKEVLL